MNIIKALCTENLRVSNGDRWLCASQNEGVNAPWFTVYERTRYARNTKQVCCTTEEDLAVRVLLHLEPAFE